MKQSRRRWLLPFCITATVVSCQAESWISSDYDPERDSSAASEASAPRAGMMASRMAYPTGDESTSAVLIERYTPAEVALGKEFETETRITNITSMTLDDVVLSELTHGNFVLASASPKPAVSERGYEWHLGNLGPDESRTINVRGAAKQATTVDSCMSVSYTTALCTHIPVVEPKLSLTARGSAEVIQCDGIVYEYVVTNAGTGSAREVTVEAQLPEGLTVNGRRSFSKNVGTLEAGASEEFSVKAIPARTGEYEHQAHAKSSTGLTADSEMVATVVRKPKLEITGKAPATSFAGRDLTYSITVTNVGDGVARDTVLEDSLATGTTFESASDRGVHADGRVTWELGDLEPGEAREVTVRVGASELGQFVNRASARAYCAEAVLAVAQTEVRGIPAILLEVVDLEDPIEVGQNETYLITVTNQGTAAATNVKIAVTLPDNVKFVNSSGATRGPNAASALRSFSFEPVQSIAPKQEVTWRIIVQAEKAADARFRVSMTSDQLSSPVDETEATNYYE